MRHGLRLNYLTIGYNVLEAVASLGAGVTAGSVSLIGFGFDSAVEVSASIAAQWRLRSDADAAGRARVERRTRRTVGLCFLTLAAWVAFDATHALLTSEIPSRTILGIAVLVLSMIVMPLLARAKRRVARALSSGALAAEAKQTDLCAYLSAIAFAGVALNALLGWWWADPVAALAMTPIIAIEGWKGIQR